MIVEAISKIVKMSRETLLDTDRGKMIYNDNHESYDRLYPFMHRDLSNVESLIKVVVEEARRRENDDGEMMTVIFTALGGKFYVDDKENGDTWNYNRTLSQQWEAINRLIDKPMSHIEFIRGLQKIYPSMVDYDVVAPMFRKVSFGGKTKVVSQPIVEAGKAGRDISFDLDVEGHGQYSEHLPGELRIELQYAKASSMTYPSNLYIDMALEDKEYNPKPIFTLVWPEKEIIEERALHDEFLEFQNRLSEKLPNLLAVLDY